MAKYRKKIKEFEAWPWDEWPKDAPWEPYKDRRKIKLENGYVSYAHKGAYLIRISEFVFHTYSKKVFEERYEAVEE